MSTTIDPVEAYFHVYYEIRCLNDCLFQGVLGRKYEDPIDGGDITSIVQDSLNKACLLHLRNLAEFFECPSGKNNQISHQDYGYSTKALLPKQTRRRLNNDLAHLTYDRLNREPGVDTLWSVKNTFGTVLGECKAFLEHVYKKARIDGNLADYDRRPIQNTENLIQKLDLTLTLVKKNTA